MLLLTANRPTTDAQVCVLGHEAIHLLEAVLSTIPVVRQGTLCLFYYRWPHVRIESLLALSRDWGPCTWCSFYWLCIILTEFLSHAIGLLKGCLLGVKESGINRLHLAFCRGYRVHQLLRSVGCCHVGLLLMHKVAESSKTSLTVSHGKVVILSCLRVIRLCNWVKFVANSSSHCLKLLLIYFTLSKSSSTS